MEDIAVGQSRGVGGERVDFPAHGPGEERGVARVHFVKAQGQRPGQGGGEDDVQERGAGQAAPADQRGVSWVDRVAVSCAFSAKKIAAP